MPRRRGKKEAEKSVGKIFDAVSTKAIFYVTLTLKRESTKRKRSSGSGEKPSKRLKKSVGKIFDAVST